MAASNGIVLAEIIASTAVATLVIITGVELCSTVSEITKTTANHHNCGESFGVSNSESTIEQRPQRSFGLDSDFVCSEQFSYDDDEDDDEFSSSQTLSDFHSEPLDDESEINFSDYSPSFFIDSGSQFSQGSVDDLPSPTLAFLQRYRDEFTRSVTAVDLDAAPEMYKHESTVRIN